MNPCNGRIRDYLGVNSWHEAGYTGRRGLTATGELWSDDVTDHGYKSRMAFLEIAPEREVVSIPCTGVASKEMYRDFADRLSASGADTWWLSESRKFYSPELDETLAGLDDRCTMLIASGNTTTNDLCRWMESPYIIGVASALLFGGRPVYANYGYRSPYIDFATIASVNGFSGTSCATPVLAGLCALVNDMAFDVLGRPLTRSEMRDFLRGCCQQNKTPAAPVDGKDPYWGFGLPVLPPPETVDLYRYEKEGYKDLNIIEHNWSWAGTLTRRSTTDDIVLHHAAAVSSTPEQINAAHLANGWSGIGYHFYVRKDGTVHRGRPLWASGAHVLNENYHTLGVCFEGNYEEETTMPAAQLEAGQALLLYLREAYPNAAIKRHKDYMATACPGRFFPFDKLLCNKNESEEQDLTTAEATALFNKLWAEKMNNLSAAPDWAATELEQAKQAGITDGQRPNAPCTRVEAAIMVKRAVQHD